MPRFFGRFFIHCACWFFLTLAGLSLPALASDAPKAPPPKEKEPTFANEEGKTGRSGAVYKRVLKEGRGEPEPVAKVEPKPEEAKKDAKDAHGKTDDHGKADDHAPKKEEKHDDGHGAPAKEEKKKDAKKDDGHGGGHGAPKKEPPTVSNLYDPAVIKLDGNNRPLTPVVQKNDYADYFLCHKTVPKKYQETILNEMNTFADRMNLPRAQDMPCMVKVTKLHTKFPGAVFIEFYVDEKSAASCIRLNNCISTRLVMLYPKDKKAKTVQEIYRSYVLTDERKYKRSSFCVSPEGQLLGEKNCYVALHPDWLFN
jgi:hypothetical protein